VAPLSTGVGDDRYVPFFDTVGTDACRQQLREVQRLTLQQRDMIVNIAASFSGATFDLLGAERAVEWAIAEEEWSFWQYVGSFGCDFLLPDPATADAFDLYFFLDQVNSVDNYGDVQLDLFQPYYYQSSAQLGYPALPTANIADLLEYDPDDITPLLPAGTDPQFDPGAMEDIAAWIGSEAAQVMLIYGEWDPWYAGAMDVGSSPAAVVFVAPEANHGAAIRDLTDGDFAQALAAIEEWTGVTPNAAAAATVPRPDLRRMDVVRRR
jgi:hypothetical protein